jgi:hypothetical protein
MLFDIIIGIYIESQLNIFSFVAQISSKMEKFGKLKTKMTALKSKIAFHICLEWLAILTSKIALIDR